MAEYSEKLSELIKSSTIVTILVLFLISIPVLVIYNNSKFQIFEPFHSPNSSEKNDGNITDNNFKGVVKNVTELVDVIRNSSSDHSPLSSRPHAQNSLDGLIISGFDKPSCLSRYQSSSYRRLSPYKPSPYLISRLRRYEELHARCGPHSVSYRRTVRTLSRSTHLNETAIPTPCRYLVWTAVNGLGNRMVSIVSAFLYSLLSNRVLLLDFEHDMNDLFCEPFPNSSWVLPENFPHRRHWSRLPSFKEWARTRNNECFPSIVHLNLQHGGDGDYNIKHFHCDEFQLLDKIAAVVLISDQYFVPALFLMSSFKDELNRMFPDKVTVFHHLGRYLFHPSNEVWGLITRFYQAYLSKSEEKIGLQIRTFDADLGRSKAIKAQIFSCIETHGILPALDANAAPHTPTSENQTSKSKSVLIASLHSEYADELRSMYWTRATTTGDVVGVYQPSHEEYQKHGDNMHNMKAWAEIYLLSLCDVLVTSPQSTFGYVAQSLGGVNPWVMVGLGSPKAWDPPCKRSLSMEPCFHHPPEYDCQGKNKIDNITSISPFLFPCDDLWWGIKLR